MSHLTTCTGQILQVSHLRTDQHTGHHYEKNHCHYLALSSKTTFPHIYHRFPRCEHRNPTLLSQPTSQYMNPLGFLSIPHIRVWFPHAIHLRIFHHFSTSKYLVHAPYPNCNCHGICCHQQKPHNLIHPSSHFANDPHTNDHFRGIP